METVPGFASEADHAVCRSLHRRYGTTYYFATRLFKPETRKRVHALYAFVRVPDEWVDNPAGASTEEVQAKLVAFRQELRGGIEGLRPQEPVLRAFCDLIRETGMPLEEPLAFLEAMESDLRVQRYATFRDLRAYMRGSAAAVGVMMLYALGAPRDQETVAAACALGEAMQLTNFLRDVGEDAARGRIYLPGEDLASFGVSEAEIFESAVSDGFASLMRFEIERARVLYRMADIGIARLPEDARKAVRLARVLYSRILDRIEAQGYDVFGARARTTKAEKLTAAARVLLLKG